MLGIACFKMEKRSVKWEISLQITNLYPLKTEQQRSNGQLIVIDSTSLQQETGMKAKRQTQNIP
jgi:hypothetical protein